MTSPYRYVRDATRHGESLLSLCSGIGLELKHLKARSVTAVDIVPQYLVQVQSRCPRAQVVCVDALTYTKMQKDQSVDVISLIDGLEHMTKDVGMELIFEMKRVCAKAILLYTPEGYVRNEPHDAWGVAGGDEYQVHKCGWTKEELAYAGFSLLLKEAGVTQHGEPYHAMMYRYQK